MAGAQASTRPGPSGVRGRDPDQDQHGPVAGMGEEGQTPQRLRAPWPLAHHDLPGRPAHGRAERALRLRRPHQRPLLPGPGQWAEQQLVPTLKPGDIVILDNLASHKAKARSDRRFGAPAPDCGSCRPIHRTSTPSSRPSPRSSTGCATPKNEASTTHAVISDASSKPSSPASARTTSKTPDMVPTKTDALQSAADDLRDLLIA